MKKSTILILLIVFLGSVIVVGVFGMQANLWEAPVYINEIIPTSVATISGKSLEIKRNEQDGYYYVRVAYEENLTVLISTRVEPVDSTNKSLKISVTNNNDPENPRAEVGERGEIIVRRTGVVKVQYRAQDKATAAVMEFWIYVTQQ